MKTILKTVHLGAFVIVLLSCAVVGCGPDEGHRGNDPWVFRSVLDWQPRMITFALAEDFWVSYHTDNASLYRVWSDGVSFEGPVYNQSHGPQPVSLGNAFVSSETTNQWRVNTGDTEYTPNIIYRGHQFVGNGAELHFDLTLTDGSTVGVVEAPELLGSRTLQRTFTLTDVPDGISISVAIDASSLQGDDAFETTGTFEIGEETSTGHNAKLVLNSHEATVLALTFVEGAPIETSIRAPGAEDDVDLPDGLVLINASDCSVCHNADAQTVGPSYMMIAEKYVNSEYNSGVLANKIVQGGTGNWGDVAMTPHPDMSAEDAKTIATYILSLDGESVADEIPSGRDSYPIDDSFGENPDKHGVVMNAYRFSEPVREMPDEVDSYDPVFSGVVPGVYAPVDADFGELTEDFYIEVSGSIVIPETSNYVFRLISDDGAFMYLDGEQIIDNDGLHGPRPADGEVYLEAGEHPFDITYFQGGGQKALALQWIRHGEEAFTRVPTESFRYDPEDLKVTKPFVRTEKLQQGIPGDGIALRDVHPAFDLETIRPENFHPMVGGLDVMSNGDVVVSTWEPDGGIYVLSNVDASNREDIVVTKVASGLLEPLGLKVVGDKIYVLQKHELTRLTDTDDDGIMDRYETICAGWGVSSNFHEFAFGLVYQDGYFYATLATAILPGGASADPQVQDRGRVIKIDPTSGSYEFIASGLRTPNGIGVGVDDEIFVADNQGDWLPSSKILHVSDGAFFGSRSVDFEGTEGVMEKLPVVWLPQDEIGNSPSQPSTLDVGPYRGQMIHGEVTHGGVKRVYVEQVDGEYQGAVFRFTQGLEAGVNRLAWGADNKLYIGGIGNPGNWGHADKKWYGLQRLSYNGKPAFEMLAVKAKSNGFEIEFTESVSDGDLLSPESFQIESWRYVPTVEYGGPKVGLRQHHVSEIHVSENRKSVFLKVDGLSAGTVVHVYIRDPLVSREGRSLWTTEAWYTLNRIPKSQRGDETTAIAENPFLNKLTEAEVAEGWQMLFDGKSTDGWRNYGSTSIGSDWRIENGALTLSGPVNEGWQISNGGDIVTLDTYENFDLRLDWKISQGGNSGIFFNIVEDTDSYSYPWETGPEMQILDDNVHSDGRYVRHRSGDLYDLIAGDATPTRPVGQWNQVRIKQEAGHVQQWLNGQLMVEHSIGSPEWQELVASSKFGSMEGFGKATSGRIGLQDHGNRVSFRNIKIRNL